jgi:hypothetical protein
MDEIPVEIFTLPGIDIIIDDGLDWFGLGIITVNCIGSRDIPAFTKKCVVHYPYAEKEAACLPLTPVEIPEDSRLVSVVTRFSTAQYTCEDFTRECVVLEVRSQNKGLDTRAGLVLQVLGKLVPIPNGATCPSVSVTMQ